MQLRRSVILVPLFAAVFTGCAAPQQPSAAVPASGYDIVDKSLTTLAADLAAKRVTSEELVALYAKRIRALDQSGPEVRSVIALNPRAADAARALDVERAEGRVRGPLHGLPILIKDNIETVDPLATTAGSLALEQNFAVRDAAVVARLREAGAVVLGKTNLSEWANMRSLRSTSGWSAVGGLTKNPYALERDPCGSSSGSGAAVAASFAAAAIGTETDGSITCPSSVLGLVGVKPTLGLVSRSGVIPISSLQDTAGPMTRTVEDAALVLRVLVGADARDATTQNAAAHQAGLAAALDPNALAGRRFGLLKFQTGYLASVDALFHAAVAELEKAGATVSVVEAVDDYAAIEERELTVLLRDFRNELNAYLATTPASVSTRSLAQLIAFNREHAARELPHFGQDLFERAEATAQDDPADVQRIRALNKKAAAEGLDRVLAAGSFDALIAPTLSPAWVTDLVNGDHALGGATTLPAVAGYPHVTVPMGQVSGLPVGLSFIGGAFSDARLLSFAFAYEQRTRLRRAPVLP
jgi:amidase